ncbi:Neuroendocrine convertase 1 [Hypsibius exemplaris]|uniref:Neuroendocrine convertase 1 n=1 Tax=Hypsibius exemplaris TaxID=2072580 RepID=A0A1W0WA67_HYPEX|nr:Neuroendocrine convertase 1 [Hypsibius exemplaris]
MAEVPGGLPAARAIGERLGLQVVKQYSWTDPEVFVFRRPQEKTRRSKRHARAQDKLLEDDFRVTWSQRQVAKVRHKRDYIHSHREVIEDDNSRFHAPGSQQQLTDLDTLPLQLHPTEQLHHPKVAISLGSSPSAKLTNLNFNDPQFRKQWYLLDGTNPNGRAMRSMTSPGGRAINLNVLPVWKSGLTGDGVVVTILDDGIETNHTDLIQNYDPEASTDVNGEDRDPTPRYDNPEDTHHGTRCAGEVAMQANNNVCGVGIAFNAKIGGIRMLDGSVTDRVEAEAFSFNNNHIDIYSSSWGPSDDGRTVEAPGLMASRAMEKGVTEGRKGKGVIYVWASGNGGISGDSCAYDGYASNIHTLSIGSSTEHGHFPIYGEICASTMAVTYSSGSLTEGKIVSSDILNGCTTEHTGTSASAPLAAGMLALALEANPDLSWRDAKHVVAWSADPFPLLNNPGWSVNGAGLLVSPAFGFGLMDAERLVKVAKMWQTVPPRVKCVVRKTGIEETLFTMHRPLEIQVRTQACQGTANEINHLEQVEVIVSLSHLKRGAVRVFLTSPSGTKTLIAPRRDMDSSTDGLNGWSFISVHNWAEKPFGMWIVNLESHVNETIAGGGTLHSLRLVFHGTKDAPGSLNLVKEWRNENLPVSPVKAQGDGMRQVALIVPVPHGNASRTAGHFANQTATTSSGGLFGWIRKTVG